MAALHFTSGHGASLMNIDPAYLTLSLLFSALGLALCMYGRKSRRTPHLMAGLALMTCPYFITHVIAMTSICIVLAALPFLMPET